MLLCVGVGVGTGLVPGVGAVKLNTTPAYGVLAATWAAGAASSMGAPPAALSEGKYRPIPGPMRILDEDHESSGDVGGVADDMLAPLWRMNPASGDTGESSDSSESSSLIRLGPASPEDTRQGSVVRPRWACLLCLPLERAAGGGGALSVPSVDVPLIDF